MKSSKFDVVVLTVLDEEMEAVKEVFKLNKVWSQEEGWCGKMNELGVGLVKLDSKGMLQQLVKLQSLLKDLIQVICF